MQGPDHDTQKSIIRLEKPYPRWPRMTLRSCDPEYTVADIKSDVVEWQTHLRDIWLPESECHLHIKITHNTSNGKWKQYNNH